MDEREVTRRAVLQGGAALAGLAALGAPLAALAAPAAGGESVIPWLDQPAAIPPPAQGILGYPLVWEELASQITPDEKFFTVSHHGMQIIREPDYRLTLDGLVGQPLSLSLADIRALPRRDITFTLECSGNHGLPFLIGGIGNAVWTGTPLAPLLRQVAPQASEIVFWGSDSGPASVGDPPAPVVEYFARSMSLAEALEQDILLCYDMNGTPLHPAHGFPLRLIAPGWYGIANVKWLRRIEVLNTRYEGRFMTREYVTQRTVTDNGKETVRFTLVGRALLKSAPARVVRGDGGYRIEGVAWGAPIGRVEVRVDDAPWRAATVAAEGGESGIEWRRWSLPVGAWAAGEHTVTARAFDTRGNLQPAPDDPSLATKLTYWESNGQITRKVQIA